jgi:hypothetical protein
MDTPAQSIKAGSLAGIFTSLGDAPANLSPAIKPTKPAHIPQANWDKWDVKVCEKFAELEALNQAKAAKLAEKKPKAKRPAAKKFTTEYAVDWGKAQGWKLVERERYDARTNRHHDLAGGADVRFRDSDGRVIFVQGAGKSERAEHYRRFDDRRHQLKDFNSPRFIYVEFERGNKTPIKEEEWI